MIRVVAALIEKDNKILLAQRLGGSNDSLWEFPGGKVEEGESDEEAIEREIKEELGIVVKANNFVINNVFDYPEKQIDLRLYKCKYIEGNIILNAHKDYKFVSKKDILSYNLVPADIELAKVIIST